MSSATVPPPQSFAGDNLARRRPFASTPASGVSVDGPMLAQCRSNGTGGDAAMENAIHQMTMSYKAAEDRLLLRVSTRRHDEHRFWLTRRFVIVLWPALVKAIERRAVPTATASDRARKAAIAVQHHEAVEAADMSQPHDEEGLNRAATEAPLLVTGGACTPLKGGGARLVLDTVERAKITLNLSEELLHALCHQIETVTDKAEWGLGLTVGDPTVIVPAGERRVH
jgi:hypothetical protein